MSRIIVRNLPDQITKEKLQTLFSEKGQITDIQLKYTKDGKFRKFGFVGFKNPEQASAVTETFNKTFINASQIQIDLCAELSDPNKPRSWSKHAPDSSAYKKIHNEINNVNEEPDKKKKRKNKKIKDPEVEKLLKDHKDDPLFKDFLKTHLPGDDVLSELAKEEESCDEGEEKTESSENNVANKEISDLEYLQLKTGKKLKLGKSTENEKSALKYKLFTIKIKGLPSGTTKSEIKEFLKPAKLFNIRRSMKLKSIAYCTFKLETDLKKALLKHRSFLGGKRIFVSISKSKEDESPEKESKWKEQEERLKNEESVAESGRIFLRNLPYNVTEDEITELFQKFGPISEIIVPIDSFTRLTKGYGIVTFLMPEHAVSAFNELDGTIFQGRMLHLLPGIASKSHKDNENNDDDDGGNFKKRKMGKQKSEANSSTNWNTFFIGENTLAEAMASTYKTTKENVLDDTKSGTAVRLALGETQMVNQIKEFLEENEVCLESFNNLTKCPRSKNVILVKNLPFGTKIQEIRDKFAGYGELKRIILPPNGVAAIIEFIEPSEARKAFKSVAYSKFKHVPMYLEWAPETVFSKAEKRKEEKVEEEKPHESVEGAIIFVKNLNFSTDSSKLREHFEKCGGIVSATVAERKDPKNPGKKLSMGYGFVEFTSKEEADKALRDLQFSKLEDHTLELKRSNRTTKAEDPTFKKSANLKGKPSTKILVRNIPFQAKQKEVEQLFKVFGEIKSVRLPKKMVGSGSHRGFCFVEFHTIHDAKRAFKALSQSTHLYGRRLVLEWADSGDDVETLREKTKEQYAPSVEQQKTGKKNINIEEVTYKKNESESESD